MAAKRSRAKGKPRTTKSSAKSGGFSVAKGGLLLALMVVAVATGYVWRSYYPLALPFESPLVSDKSSVDLGGGELKEIARAANTRADAAEKESKRLQKRINELEANQREAEREMGDMQIRSILSNSE